MKQPPSLLDDIFCVVRDIQMSIEQGKQFGEWQLCPKCDGWGCVDGGTHGVIGKDVLITLSQSCPVCNGDKILARPIINDK